MGNLHPFALRESHYAEAMFYFHTDATELNPKSQGKREQYNPSSSTPDWKPLSKKAEGLPPHHKFWVNNPRKEK